MESNIKIGSATYIVEDVEVLDFGVPTEVGLRHRAIVFLSHGGRRLSRLLFGVKKKQLYTQRRGKSICAVLMPLEVGLEREHTRKE